MRVGMQLRLWLAEAPASQVVATTLVIGAVVALLVASLYPSDDGAGTTLDAAGGSFSADGASGDGGVGGDGGSGTDVLGDGTEAGGGTAGLGGAGGRSGTGGTGGGSGGSAGGAPVRLTASDTGVTADSIKVGFLVVNLAGLNATGQALGLRGDIEQVIDAYVAEVNKAGGINGRKVVAVKRRTDTTSQGDGIAACTQMLEDEKVFGVVDTFATVYQAVQRCFTIDGKAPFSHSYLLSEAFQAAGGGYDVGAPRNIDRAAREWVAGAKADGFLKGGENVGVITDTCEPSHGVVRDVLVPGIKAAGAGSVKQVDIDCDTSSQSSQVPNAVLQLKVAGVTHMFLAVSFLAATNFTINADSQAWRPKYFVSDFYGLTTDLFSKNFSPNQFDGVHAVTSTYSGQQAAGRPISAGAKKCGDMLVRHGLPGISDINRDAEALGICDQFVDVFVAAAKEAGPNLTRPGWAQAVGRLGKLEVASNDSTTFRPGKYSGGDTIASIEWRADCPYAAYRPSPCWVALTGFRPGAA
jgi:ABC-type branched-subunit amino acid transport system substrate-binding protein